MSIEGPKTKTFANIEFLRFLGVFLIMLSHFHHFGFEGLSQKDWYHSSEQPFYNVLKFAYTWGWTSVELFWLMSGFIFFFQYSESIRNKLVSGRKFAILRLSRIYPVHIVTALFVFGMQFWYRALVSNHESLVYPNNSFGDLVLNIFMAGNWNPYAAFSLNGPFWSVSVEIIAYVLFFLLMRYFKFPLWFTAISPVLLIVTTYFLIDNTVTDGVLFFFTGGAIYLAYTQYARITSDVWKNVIRTVLVLATLTFAAILNAIGSVEALQGKQYYLFYAMLFCALGAAAVLPQAGGKLGRVFSEAGNTTYASLLIHFPIQLAIMVLFEILNVRAPYTNPLFFLGWFLLTYALSVLSFYKFERPIQNWMRKKFNATRPQK